MLSQASVKFRDLFKFKKREIDTVFNAVSYRRRLHGLSFLSSKQIDISRTYGKLLIIISRKVGKACFRNKIRRRLQAVFYEDQLYRHLLSSVCVVKPEIINNFQYCDLRKNLLKYFASQG